MTEAEFEAEFESEILSRLNRYSLFRDCRMQVVHQEEIAKLFIIPLPEKTGAIASAVLGIARLAQSLGLHQIIISSGCGLRPLVFSVESMIYYGVDMELLNQLRERATRHRPLIESLPHDMIFLHSQEEPHYYLDVRVQIEERLNVPLLDLLGSPVDRVDSELAEKRRFYLQKAVRSGCVQKYDYTYHWNGWDWEFKVSCAPLYGSEEAIAITKDAKLWQGHWWTERFSDGANLVLK